MRIIVREECVILMKSLIKGKTKLGILFDIFGAIGVFYTVLSFDCYRCIRMYWILYGIGAILLLSAAVLLLMRDNWNLNESLSEYRDMHWIHECKIEGKEVYFYTTYMPETNNGTLVSVQFIEDEYNTKAIALGELIANDRKNLFGEGEGLAQIRIVFLDESIFTKENFEKMINNHSMEVYERMYVTNCISKGSIKKAIVKGNKL